VITPLGELELANAFQLRRFRKEIENREARGAQAAFRADLRNGVVLMRDIPEDGFSYALRLVQKWTAKLGTRSLDIIPSRQRRPCAATLFSLSTSASANLPARRG